MKNFIWSDKLSVNIEEIDTQHKEFINLTNELSGAVKSGVEGNMLGEILFNLIEYAEMHFATEERLMKLHGYPEFENHKREHEELKKTINGLNRRVNTGQLSRAATVAIFLEDWITNHLLTTDKKYTPYLNSKGVR